MSNEAMILRRFHCSLFILHLSFAIAGTERGNQWQMANVKLNARINRIGGAFGVRALGTALVVHFDT